MSKPVVRVIRVEVLAEGGFEVSECGRTTGEMTWGEMLESVAEITHPKIGATRYPMKTPGEWAALRERSMLRRASNRSTKEPA